MKYLAYIVFVFSFLILISMNGSIKRRLKNKEKIDGADVVIGFFMVVLLVSSLLYIALEQ